VLNVATAVPDDPTSLIITTNISASRADLTWTDNTLDLADNRETGFMIQRRPSTSGGTGTWTTLATTVPNQNSYSDFTIQAGVAYEYQVYAYNQAGSSVKSAGGTLNGPAAVVVSGSVYTLDPVTNANVPLAGVIINFVDASSTLVSTTTLPDGSYAISSLASGWTGTITAVKTGFSFSPATIAVAALTAALPGQNFLARPAMITIQGKVGSIPTGVAVTMNSNAGDTATVATDGTYTLTVANPFTGKVFPTATGLVFTPVNRPITGASTNLTGQDFTAQVQITSAINYVLGGLPLTGVKLTATSNVTGILPVVATEGPTGFYTLTLPTGWTGTVTPSLIGYVFTPASLVVAGPLNASLRQDFTYVPGVEVSGQIYVSSIPIAPLPGLTVTFSNGGGTVTTDANGNYINFVPRGWTGTVTPSGADAKGNVYAFNPLTRNFTNVTTVQTGRNFVVSSTVVLSGIIYSGTTPLNGVTVTLNNGGGTFVTGTAINGVVTPGYYQITLNSGWTGTVTPTARGRIFNPTSIVQQLTVDTTLNFYTYQSITGQARVRVNGTNYGVPGVTITATGSGSALNATATTTANGNFTLLVLTGWTGAITASGGTNPVTTLPITIWNPTAGFVYSATPLAGQFLPVTTNVTGLRFTGQ